ncbi:cytochrome P450 [Streptomyces sp. WAC01526]|uniref:cytochrome P450 n=1 Tax=Streptomyces sp. WAC01526 TaxID=2588709 RepID=UPI0021CCC9EA|nr:cytochrome P450 [Streptomyces sp. WAC01526]
MNFGEMRRFRRDPLTFLEDFARRNPEGVFRLPWGAWCVSDAELALTVLRDPIFNGGLSTFFGDLLPTRESQIALGRSVRNAMKARASEYRDNMFRAAPELPEVSQWPATGPRLVYQCTKDLLLHPDSPPRLRRLMAEALNGGLMLRSPRIRQRARAEMLRPRLSAAVTEHVAARRRESTRNATPCDLLDAVISACPDDVSDPTVARLYMLLFRSIVGSIGYAVAWSLLLACLHSTPGSHWPWPADWIVREAARHRPLVWMVGRTVPHPTDFGGIAFESGSVLSVSPYLLQHDPRRWDRPKQFLPERWGEPDRCGPYLPFSAGPFTCAGAAVAHTMITAAVAAIAGNALLTVTGGDTRPVVTDAAASRRFTLYRAAAPTKAQTIERR